MHPEWLLSQIESSRRRIGLETLDVVYIADPFENGMMLYKDPEQVMMRLGDAFELL